MKKRNSHRRGAVAVEFAFAFLVLITLVFAAFEFFRINMLKHSVEHASYLAARKGIILGASSADVINAANEHLATLEVVGSSVTLNPSNIVDETQLIEVKIDVPYSGNSWISPIYFNGSISARTRMLSERSAADMLKALPNK